MCGQKRQSGAPWVAFELLDADGKAMSRAWQDAMEVAAWMRHAAGEALRGRDIGEDVDAYVLGHPNDGDDASHRMSLMPLPSIGHAHADGRIRRVMFCEPPAGNGRAVELLADLLPGVALTDEHGHEVCSLVPPSNERVVEHYVRRSVVWRSVTPVILHGFNSAHGKISVAKTESLLLRAFEMAGHKAETIEQLAFQPAPLWSGTGGAGSIRVPLHLRKYPRYHVEVRFRRAVPGLVLAGLGRHCGIGVFASVAAGR